MRLIKLLLGLLLLPALAWADITTGLLAHWTFNEASGNALDASGNGRTATAVGTPPRVAGKIGNAASLNGTTQYFTVADVAALNPVNITVAAWINPAVWDTDFTTVVSKQASAFPFESFDFRRAVGSTTIEAAVTVLGGEWKQAGSAISTGVWTHVAMTYDGLVLRVYNNGVETGANTTTGGNIDPSTGTALWIGNNPSFGPRLFQGLIDDVRLYNRALTATDMTELFLFGSARKRPALWFD